MSPLVLVEESPAAGSRHEVEAGATIGREGTDVVLADPEVSRRHARIRTLDAGPAIEDLDSSNGTFLNGHRLTGVAELRHGDMLKMGNSSLRVEIEAEAGATRLRPVPSQPTAATPTSPPPAPAPAAPAPPAPAPAASSPPAPAPAPSPPATAPPASAPPRAPAQPAGAAEGARGDVPPPPPESASRVHRAFQGSSAPAKQAFDVEAAPSRRRGSAATRIEATLVAYGVVVATGVAVALYLVGR